MPATPHDEFPRDPYPVRTQIIGWGPAFFLAFVALGIAGIIWGPDLQRRWVENSREHLDEKRREQLAADLEVRKELARAEADGTYRKREAEMKAEAIAIADRLQNRKIEPSSFRDVYRKAAPSVVRISADGLDRAGGKAEGSGIIARIDKQSHKAYVVTCSHVVQAEREFGEPRTAEKAVLTLASGRVVNVGGGQIHADSPFDIAVLVFDCRDIPDLVAAEFAMDDPPEQGDWAIAIGHPFGLTQTMTVGIVSAVGRMNVPLGTLDAVPLIQTDAAINMGNSGGPLLDIRGRVIGVNTVIVSKSGGNQGVGFAIPSQTVMEIFDQLTVPPYTVSRGFLGVLMSPVDPTQALALGKQGCVRIDRVMRPTPAYKAGLKDGDYVFRYNGKDVSGVGQLRRLVMDTPAESIVEIDILRSEGSEMVEKSLKVQITRR